MAEQPAAQAGGLSRDDLYRNWLVWVGTNLGDDAQLAPIAANAAADAAVRGDGFNAAAEAARNAWVEAAPPDKALWRPSFSKLLLTDIYFWILVGAVITTPFLYVTVVLVPIFLIVVGWDASRFWRLSKRGVVVPGDLFDVKDPPPTLLRTRGDPGTYRATYHFEFHGPHFAKVSYYSKDSVRQDVLVLFDPKRPSNAMVMPELLNPEA
jgi:hypothetical protein